MTDNSSGDGGARKSATPRKAKARRKKPATSKRGGARVGAGRTPFRPSIEQRQAVEEMKFCGEPEVVIARAIGIDVDTLRKHFADELAGGHAQRRKEVIGMLFKEARGGNVSAMRKLEELGRPPGDQDGSAARPADAPRQAKLGKKQEQQQAAEQIAGKYATPPAPRLVVSN